MCFAVPERLAFQRAALFLFTLLLAAGQSTDLIAKSKLGVQLMSAGRFSDAVPVYEELVRALPSNPGLHLNLGLALHMSGRDREAIPQFETVLKSDPNSIPALTSLGAARLQLNDPANAIAPLQKLVTIQQDNTEERGMLANALLAVGRIREASMQFRRLTQLAPGDPKAWYGLGTAYEHASESAFKEITEGSAEWLVLVGESRAARGQFRSAFYFYQQALQKNPRMRGVHAAIAAVYNFTKHPDWAQTELAREASLPRPDCTREKAHCDFESGRYLDLASAKSPYWRSRAYNALSVQAFAHLGELPESVELHALKAGIAASHNQHGEAANEWRAALRLTPGDPRLERELVTAVYLAHDYGAALPLIQAALKREPHSAELNFFAGDSYLRLEQPEKALAYLDDAVRADPKLLPAQASYGMALARIGQTAAAIPHLEAALPTDDDGSLYYQLARAHQGVGESVKSRAALAKYQEIRNRNEAERQDLEEKVKITAP